MRLQKQRFAQPVTKRPRLQRSELRSVVTRGRPSCLLGSLEGENALRSPACFTMRSPFAATSQPLETTDATEHDPGTGMYASCAAGVRAGYRRTRHAAV